jgi:hypothetical protein
MLGKQSGELWSLSLFVDVYGIHASVVIVFHLYMYCFTAFRQFGDITIKLIDTLFNDMR